MTEAAASGRMECATNTRRVAGVTFVTCRLSSGRPRSVCLRNELDGPVWPPRKRGVPAAGWDEEGVTATVEGTVGVGYACPAPPTDPPATVVESRPADETTAEPTPGDVVRALGDPAPPRDAVAVDQPPGTNPTATRDAEPAPNESDRDGADALFDRDPGAGAVESWLDAVEERVERMESLADAETLPEATGALRAAGGLDGAAALTERVGQDREALAAFALRADELRERGAADPDLETLRRLA